MKNSQVGREKIIAGSRILQDNLLDDVAENDLFIIKYHSNSCYKPYVLKSGRHEKNNVEELVSLAATRRRLSISSNLELCIICQKQYLQQVLRKLYFQGVNF